MRSERIAWKVQTVKVTAKWGYAATVPYVVKEAACIQAARWYSRGKSAWSDTVGSPDMGMLMYRQKLDPDVYEMLVDGRLVRPAIG